MLTDLQKFTLTVKYSELFCVLFFTQVIIRPTQFFITGFMYVRKQLLGHKLSMHNKQDDRRAFVVLRQTTDSQSDLLATLVSLSGPS